MKRLASCVWLGTLFWIAVGLFVLLVWGLHHIHNQNGDSPPWWMCVLWAAFVAISAAVLPYIVVQTTISAWKELSE